MNQSLFATGILGWGGKGRCKVHMSEVSRTQMFRLATRSEGKQRKNAISKKNLEKQPHLLHVKICPSEGNVHANMLCEYVVWVS